MKYRLAILFLLAILVANGPATAADRVKKKNKETVFGQISAMTSREIVVDDRATKIRIPVGDIKMVYFDNEPEGLSRARAAVAQERYEDAQTALADVKPGQTLRDMVAAEVDFYRALAAAKLALRGKGEIRDAGSQMWRFVESHRDNYHWFEANRVAGDLLVASRQYAPAIRCYDTLGESSNLADRLQAAVGAGRAYLADGKTDEAMAAFTRATDMKPANPKELDAEAAKWTRLARIGRARCVAAKGQTDEAVKQLREIIDQANPEDATLCGEAYNALGTALRKAGKPQDALLAFLHVDVLYFANPESHAEALANLAELWHEVHKTDRAIQAQETLRQRYPNSRWAPQ
jgi:tetratricopeptide (TPR) repeat protein